MIGVEEVRQGAKASVRDVTDYVHLSPPLSDTDLSLDERDPGKHIVPWKSEIVAKRLKFFEE